MLKIRLTRVGKKNSPAYRVVVADHQKAVNRKFIEILGHYNPAANPKVLVIDKEKALYWISKGAQASDTVNNLMVDLGILAKTAKVKKVYGKKTKKKTEAKPDEAEKPAATTEKADETVETTEDTEEPKTETTEDKTEDIEEAKPTENTETVEAPVEE